MVLDGREKANMQFNSAKGVLVVDPLEARNICIPRVSSSVYCLFQIDNRVFRSRTTTFKAPSVPQWREDSQCRFDIDPGVTPLLKIYVLEKTNGLPKVVGKGEIDLVNVFYEKRLDKWTKLSPMGQINIEYTFYQAAPMLPMKAPSEQPLVPMKDNQTETLKAEKVEQAKAKISSVDRVFMEEKEERSRLRRLASKVRRRYERRSSYRELEVVDQSKKMTNDELLIMEVDQSPENSPVDDNTRRDSDEGDVNINAMRIETQSLAELDLNKLPFSADSIGDTAQFKIETLRKEQMQKRKEVTKNAYKKLSPTAFAIINRLEQGRACKDDFRIDGGASEYRGDGTWAKGRLTDATFTEGKPTLPPKIPVGMTSEEYYMLHRKEYLGYFQQIL